MTEGIPATKDPNLAWLPLIQKPYENPFGPRSAWDLRTANGTAVRIERGSHGLTNNLYRVRLGQDVYACKLFIADERQRARREWIALRSLQEARLRVAPDPIVYAPDGPLPQPTIVHRWVSGKELTKGSVTDNDLMALVADLNQIHQIRAAPDTKPLIAWHQPANFADYLAEIQTFVGKIRAWTTDARFTPNDLPFWATNLLTWLPLFEKALRLAENVIAQADTKGEYLYKALIWGDGNLDNVIRSEQEQFIFLNWESSGWGDPAYDLAQLRWHPRASGISQTRWQAALNTYVPHPGDRYFRERLAVYSQLLPIWWVGRSALHLLEGARQAQSHQRLAMIPSRIYRSVRVQLRNYLAALGLMEPEGKAKV